MNFEDGLAVFKKAREQEIKPMTSSNFITDVLNGEALIDDVDIYVAFWHENNMQQSLVEFLGFSDAEYDSWMLEGNSVIRDILYCRRNGVRFEDLDREDCAGKAYRRLSVLDKYVVSA